MTNEQIEQQFEIKVREERRLTAELIQLIALVDERMIYAERGYSSLFDWLTKRYGYSEGAANRRISAARVLRAVPEVSDQVQSGKLNLTTLSRAHVVFRAQERAQRDRGEMARLDVETKKAALERIEGRSARETEQSLLQIFPDAAARLKSQVVTSVSADTSRLHADVSREVLERFEKVRAILSNRLPNAGFVEVADFLFQKLIDENAKPTAVAAKQSVNPFNKTITPRTRRIVIHGGRCSYRDPVTGQVCGSNHQLQVDHIQPRALGGGNQSENLRPLCATHNRLMAEKKLGRSWARRWRNDPE